MSTTILAKVNGIAIQAIEENRQKLIPIKPICEALGIDEDAQRRKLQDDEFLSSTAVLSTVVAADGKQREMVCLPMEFIFGWLFTINPKNVKPEAQAAVVRYRIECYRALYSYFTRHAEFVSYKNEELEKALEAHRCIKTEFRSAKERLAEAENHLNRVRKLTIEEWAPKNKQMKINFLE